jgi:branched-chain amino acid transport system ATP-binding protein
MLLLDNVKAVYGGVVLALDEVTMEIAEGSAVVLLGSNGSGKSTTLKSISGVLRVEEGELTEGSVTLDGRRIDKLAPEEIAGLGVCHVLQGRSVFPQLTTDENLKMGAYLRRNRQEVKEDLERIYEYFPKLAPLRTRKSGYLSGGEQQMLVIRRAMMARPRIMLLDEPSLGLAPSLIGEIFGLLKRIKQEQATTLLIAEQNAAVLQIADYGYVLQNGRVTASGTAAELAADSGLRGAYLGLDGAGSFLSRHRQTGTDGEDSAGGD